MLQTLDTVIAFAVIMTVVSLLITTLVQMTSSALALRGKNLANALSLTFQTIDPTLGEYAHALAAQILSDPILSDSLFAPKDRSPVIPAQGSHLAAVISAEKQLIATTFLAKAGDKTADITTAETNVAAAKALVPAGKMPDKVALISTQAWSFLSRNESMKLATAIRPGEVYRILHDISHLTPTEATLHKIPAILPEKASDLLRALAVPDQTAQEAKSKLQAVANVADLFATPEQKKAVLDSLANFGLAVEGATTQAYDRFQRWFGSAQDRAEQWFQIHVRGITIFFSVVIALLLQLDTINILRQLRTQPVMVAALVKSAPASVTDAQPILSGSRAPNDAAELFKQQQQNVDHLQQRLADAGFDLVPESFLGRWGHPRRLHLFDHLTGTLITAALLTLGAPFWFNLLKNLMNLRPAVATLIERRPQSSLSLAQVPIDRNA
ncbi:MAG: hypothetical protein H0X40_12155 [Chthoniobacterales bacterium]|nr:hypothetical protein [Chthoniobacterales bacterium]